jgi:hypothetical protein
LAVLQCGGQRRSFADFAAPRADDGQGQGLANADGSPGERPAPVLGNLFGPTAGDAQGPAAQGGQAAGGGQGPAGGPAPIATDAKSFFFGNKEDKADRPSAPEAQTQTDEPQAASEPDQSQSTDSAASEPGQPTEQAEAPKGFFAATEEKSVDDGVQQNLAEKSQETKGFFGVTTEKSADEVVAEKSQQKASENKGFFGATRNLSIDELVSKKNLERNSGNKGFFAGASTSQDD